MIPSEIFSAVSQRLLGRDHVDEGGVEVVDLEPDGVLELGLGDPLRLLGDDRARLALAADVERIGDVDIVLRRAAGITRV